MIAPLLVAFALAGLTVILHGVATMEAFAHLSRAWKRTAGHRGRLAAAILLVRAISVLLLLPLIEAALWACFYVIAGVLPDFETALYFSLTSYTTVGYGDVPVPRDWRLLGPSEGAVGILMFGWSTGVMVTAISKVYGERL